MDGGIARGGGAEERVADQEQDDFLASGLPLFFFLVSMCLTLTATERRAAMARRTTGRGVVATREVEARTRCISGVGRGVRAEGR